MDSYDKKVESRKGEIQKYREKISDSMEIPNEFADVVQ